MMHTIQLQGKSHSMLLESDITAEITIPVLLLTITNNHTTNRQRGTPESVEDRENAGSALVLI